MRRIASVVSMALLGAVMMSATAFAQVDWMQFKGS
jgi:hypothetical protein